MSVCHSVFMGKYNLYCIFCTFWDHSVVIHIPKRACKNDKHLIFVVVVVVVVVAGSSCIYVYTYRKMGQVVKTKAKKNKTVSFIRLASNECGHQVIVY